jgi:hypothetical protein
MYVFEPERYPDPFSKYNSNVKEFYYYDDGCPAA